MADEEEKKDEVVKETEVIKPKDDTEDLKTNATEGNELDELRKLVVDLQGQMANIQETVDKLAPVTEEEVVEETEEQEETPAPVEDEPSEEELKELDSMLQQT